MSNPKILYTQKNATADLEVRFEQDSNGDIVISGQDLGDDLELMFGDGITEYEWSITIAKKDFDLLLKALNGGKNDNVTILFVKEFSNDKAMGIERFLKENNIPYEFQNRMGD